MLDVTPGTLYYPSKCGVRCRLRWFVQYRPRIQIANLQRVYYDPSGGGTQAMLDVKERDWPLVHTSRTAVQRKQSALKKSQTRPVRLLDVRLLA